MGEELGVEVEFVPIDWTAKGNGTGGTDHRLRMERNVHHSDRLENMELTDKYLNNKIVLMTLESSDLDVTGLPSWQT